MEIVAETAAAMRKRCSAEILMIWREVAVACNAQRASSRGDRCCTDTGPVALAVSDGERNRRTFATWRRVRAYWSPRKPSRAVSTEDLARFLSKQLATPPSAQTLAAKPLPATLLRKFTDVQIGDSSTTINLPDDEFAKEFPSCGGSGKVALAAMKIQLLWGLSTGQVVAVAYRARPRPATATASEIAAARCRPPERWRSWISATFPAGAISPRRRRGRAYWLSRFQHNTKVFDADEKELLLLRHRPKKHGASGLVDVPVLLGEKRAACRAA